VRILFYPIGGLANRMRAIDSAVNFSKAYNCKLTIFWIRDRGMNCDFNRIWKPVSFIKEATGRISGFFFYLQRRFVFIRWVLKILERWRILRVFVDEYKGKDEMLYSYVKSASGDIRYWFLVIMTCEDFFPGQSFRSDLFQLQPEIAERVKQETEGFDENTIGVHIRRSDHIHSIEHSPLELFEEYMLNELSNCPEAKFYIASDDEAVKEHFKQNPQWKSKVIFSEGCLLRDSQEGILQAVTEFYALSRTRKILGSYWSTFSELASRIGYLNLMVVKNELRGLTEKE